MATDKLSVVDSDDVTRQKALAGYQAAITLWTYQGEQWWARFNVMLTANSIVITAATVAIVNAPQAAKSTPLFSILAIALPIAGLLLCASWLVLIKREIAYADYYVRSARELEKKYLSDSVKTASRGALFAEGNKVAFENGGQPLELRMGGLARIRTRWVSKFVVLIFGALYIITLLAALDMALQ